MPERELIDACTSQIGLALEKEHFREAFQKADLIQQSDKLRKILLDNVSHELKIPVAAIRTALAAMKKQSHQPPVIEMLNEMEEASSRLESVVSLLVDSARLETGMVQPRPEWCDVHEIIEMAVKNCGSSLPKNRLIIHENEALPVVRIDPQLCAQALSHILINAVIHTPVETLIEIFAMVKESFLILTVADQGPGLTDPQRVFEKFYRENSRSGGLGLGLSISKGLVHALGGEISACNREGGGRASSCSGVTWRGMGRGACCVIVWWAILYHQFRKGTMNNEQLCARKSCQGVFRIPDM